MNDHIIREYFTVKRVNPYILSICIDAVLNMIRHEGVANILEETYFNCIDFDKMMKKYEKYLQY